MIAGRNKNMCAINSVLKIIILRKKTFQTLQITIPNAYDIINEAFEIKQKPFSVYYCTKCLSMKYIKPLATVTARGVHIARPGNCKKIWVLKSQLTKLFSWTNLSNVVSKGVS